MTTHSLLAAASGLGFGLSLIIAIGAQNAYVLRQGLRREHIGLVVAICALSDLILIMVGVAGIGALIERAPWLIAVIRYGGAAFLVVYGVMAARRVFANERLRANAAGGASGAVAVAGTMAALTWLNPHVYLDTVILLGSVANSHGPAKWAFAFGAGSGSIVWFTALGYGAQLLSGVFARARSWQVLDGAIACIMLGLGLRLALGG